MNKNRTIGLCAGMALAFFGGVLGAPSKAGAQPVTATPATMPRVATIDERYLSYNVEMAEVIGGNFWKLYDASGRAGQQTTSTGAASPAGGTGLKAGQNPTMFQTRAPIDLTNARLRKLAAALGPAYVRTSGTWANTVYFHNADMPAPATPPAEGPFVVSGAGDGGIIDALRLVHRDFRGGRLIVEAATLIEEAGLLVNAPVGEPAYCDLASSLPGSLQNIISKSLSGYGQHVRLVSRGASPFGPQPAPIHLLLLAHAMSRNAIRYEQGELVLDGRDLVLQCVGAAPEKLDPTKTVVRHGPGGCLRISSPTRRSPH